MLIVACKEAVSQPAKDEHHRVACCDFCATRSTATFSGRRPFQDRYNLEDGVDWVLPRWSLSEAVEGAIDDTLPQHRHACEDGCDCLPDARPGTKATLVGVNA